MKNVTNKNIALYGTLRPVHNIRNASRRVANNRAATSCVYCEHVATANRVASLTIARIDSSSIPASCSDAIAVI